MLVQSMQLDWVRIAWQCLGLGDPKYRLNCMYIEFENTPGSASVPSPQSSEGVDYFLGLSGNRDYLRVPLSALPSLGIGDASNYSGIGVDCDAATFTAVASSSRGENGLDFSAAADSLVYGIALVSAPVWADRTQDLVFGRQYYEVADQQRKVSNKQLSVAWTQILSLA